MNDSLDHDRWRADLAAHLLGALGPDEAAAMEAHLEDCSRCREEIRWLQPAVDLIPASIEQLDPPPELRERLLAEIGAAEPAIQAPERKRGRSGWKGFLLRPAVALGAVALLVAAVAGYSLRGGGEDTGTTTVAARGEEDVRATVEHAGDGGTLQMTGLEEAPPEHVYQAWIQHDNGIQPGSVFDARHDGTANVALPQGLGGADAVMVTVEPRGGSRQPSSSPVINVALAN